MPSIGQTMPPRGCALEVDLSYPEELHDAHNDYPVAPESFSVKADMLSDKQRDLLKEGKYKEAKKLIPNLNEKKVYYTLRNVKTVYCVGYKCG